MMRQDHKEIVRGGYHMKKHQSIAFRAATSFVLLFSLIITPQTAQASGAGKPADNTTTTQQENDNKIKLLDKKPEVADIKKQNKPNRVITNINGNPQTEMDLVGIPQINLKIQKYGYQSQKTLKTQKHLM